MTSLKQLLINRNLLDDVLLPTSIATVLDSTVIIGDIPAEEVAAISGMVQFGASLPVPLVGGFNLGPSGPAVPFTLTHKPASGDKKFELRIDLTDALGLSQLVSAPIPGLLAATIGLDNKLTAIQPPDVKITGGAASLVVDAPADADVARLYFSPKAGGAQPDGVVAIGLDHQWVMIGDTGLGLGLDDTSLIALDTTGTAKPADANKTASASDLASDTDAGWEGLSVRRAKLRITDDVPAIGGAACDLSFDIGVAPAGIALAARVEVPATATRPAMVFRVECLDPFATGLSSFKPTLVEVAVTLPVDGHKQPLANAGDSSILSLGGGDPVIARARFARAPATGNDKTYITVALEAQGENGIAMIRPPADGSDDRAAIWAIGAAGFATALIAGGKVHDQTAAAGSIGMAALMTGGAVLAELLADGSEAGKELRKQGRVRVNAVALEASSLGLAFGQQVQLKLDYSVDVPIKPIAVGTLSISLDPAQLLRIRLRGVTLTYNAAGTNLDRFAVDFQHATMDIEDPGKWLINGPGSLFDVVGTRSGRGSTWIEVDLKFKLDLGPIRVSGATIRATLNDDHSVSAGLRGLDASFALPALISMDGGLTMGPAAGAFSAHLDIGIVPLGLAAIGALTFNNGMILVHIAVDLPAPLPLGPTGLGLYGIGGLFGIKAALKTNSGSVYELLKWKADETGFEPASGQLSFGVEASVGTLPDYAFAFAAKAGLFVTVPDFALLGALDAKFLSGPVSLTKPPTDPDAGGVKAIVQGVISVVPAEGTKFALSGHFEVPDLVTITVPVAGQFPANNPDWYVYVGADGSTRQGREIGPARMVVLPKLFKQQADGYLMLRGDGIKQWPDKGRHPQDVAGFVLAFGFHVEMSFGPRPFAWAEVAGGADVLIATSPTVIAGFGTIDGSIHLGPISLGVSASLEVIDYDGKVYGKAEVCGRVHLLFVKIHRCATLHFGDNPELAIPLPNALPTDRSDEDADGNYHVRNDVTLIDDGYRALGTLSADPASAPVVWPDALVRIGCGWAPEIGPDAEIGQFGGAETPPTATPVGSAMLEYRWSLTQVVLAEQAGTDWHPVDGPLSAAWQWGKTGDNNSLGQAAELVLLTPEKLVWLQRLHDPESAPGDPLHALANACRPRIDAVDGWLLGGLARHPATQCWIPPELVSGDSKQSRLTASVIWTLDRPGATPLALSAVVASLPGEVSLISARVVTVAVKAEREFDRALSLPGFAGLRQSLMSLSNRPGLTLTATVILEEALVDAIAYFILLGPARVLDDAPIHVADGKGDWTFVSGTFAPGATGRQFAFQMPPGREIRQISIRWPADLRVGLLGINGVTGSAAAAAAKQQADAVAAAAGTAAAIAKGPGGDRNDEDRRCLLKPDTLYRLDLGFAWQGTRYKQNENGQKVLIIGSTEKPNPTLWTHDYTSGSCTRAYYFRTAAGTALPTLPSQADPAFSHTSALTELTQAQNLFEPRMLVRYQGKSEPGQGEVDRFRDDPIRFHWHVGHAARLAKLYGYDLLVVVRRVDAPAIPGVAEIIPYTLRTPTDPAFLKGTSRIRAQLARAAPCPVAVDGATMSAPVQLEPRAWYETHVRAQAMAGAPVALPGVTFRSSRWRDTPEMLAALHFPLVGQGRNDGDLLVAAGAGASLESAQGDGAFEDALRRLGLDGWPVATDPRVSLLWQLGPTWRVAGVLIESPEPIVRLGRTANVGLAPVVAPGLAAGFGICLADRTGSRLVFTTKEPFTPAPWVHMPRPLPFPTPKGGGEGGPVVRGPPRAMGRAVRVSRLNASTDTQAVSVERVTGTDLLGRTGGTNLVPLPRPAMQQPYLRLTLDDLPPVDGTGGPVSIPLTGAMALPSAPLFAGEAY